MTADILSSTDAHIIVNEDIYKMEFGDLNIFQKRAELIRKIGERDRLSDEIAEKEKIILNLLTLVEDIKTKTQELKSLEIKLLDAESAARREFGVDK